MLDLIGRLLKLGNAGLGITGIAAISTPFLLQKETMLSVPYPLVGVALLILGIYAEIARRTPPY